MESSSVSLNRKIATDELEEYQKVFSLICGSKIIEENEFTNIQYLNENNFFTSNNLTALVQKMTHNYMITKQNISSVMPKLDIKYSGMISWETFVIAMNDWINRSACFEGLYRIKTGFVLGFVERHILHYTISNFFLLNTKGISNTVSKLNTILELSGSKFDYQLIELLPEVKQDQTLPFNDPTQLLQNLVLLNNEIRTAETMLKSIQILNSIFNIIFKANGPLDFHVNSELIAKMFDFIFSQGIVDRIVHLIAEDENLLVRWESLKALSYIMFCFKIKNETFDGAQYIQNPQVKNLVFHTEFLKILFNLIYHTYFEIKEQSLICLGFIIKVSEESRDFLMSLKIVPILSSLLSIDISDRLFEKIGFVLANITISLTSNINHLMDKSLLLALAEAGYKLMSIKDIVSILRTGFEILSLSFSRVPVTSENKVVLERIMKMLELHNNVIVKKLALTTIKEIVDNNEEQAKILMDLKLLQIINEILISNEHSLKAICCRILRILARRGNIIQILESKSLLTINKIMSDTPQCRWECLKIIKTIALQSQTNSNFLVENGSIKLIFNNLEGYLEHDDILMDIYGFNGSYMNLPYLMDSLNTLNTILKNGYISKISDSLNIFADFYDNENIQKLKLVLEALFGDKTEFKSQLNRIYLKNYGDERFEQVVISLITNIIHAHKPKDGDASRFIVIELTTLLNIVTQKFQELNLPSTSPDLTTDTSFEIKCLRIENYPNGDNRLLNVSRNLTLDELKSAIEFKYSCFGPLLVKYIDKNNDILTIDNDNVLHKAINEYLSNLQNLGNLSAKGALRLIVQFETSHRSNQPKEMQCFECGKKFEILELYESTDPDEFFICYNCKREQTQFMWNTLPNLPNMSVNQKLNKSPFPFPFK